MIKACAKLAFDKIEEFRRKKKKRKHNTSSESSSSSTTSSSSSGSEDDIFEIENDTKTIITSVPATQYHDDSPEPDPLQLSDDVFSDSN